ncbi:MAG: MBL fold metallo-hydrolase [Candidatus Wallbacteria bacterium]|nr:MBL fold metallo-hydrolase [Candidatus Wallbacteria bacterium]
MPELTVVAENTTFSPLLLAEHGWSVLIRQEDSLFLFDSGSGRVLLPNLRQIGIDPSDIRGLLLSHGHNDHTGGATDLLSCNPGLMVYAHPAAFEAKFSIRGSRIRSIGSEHLQEQIAGEALMLSTELQKIVPGMFLSGEIPRRYPDSSSGYFLDAKGTVRDLILDDQFLILDSPNGLTIVLGCCHSGPRNSFLRAAMLFPDRPVDMVLGGLHLKEADPITINDTIEALRELAPSRIGLSHCTGLEPYRVISSAFPGQVFWASTGFHTAI